MINRRSSRALNVDEMGKQLSVLGSFIKPSYTVEPALLIEPRYEKVVNFILLISKVGYNQVSHCVINHWQQRSHRVRYLVR